MSDGSEVSNPRGVRQAISYALEGTCDAHLQHAPGVDALEAYGAASNSTVSVRGHQRLSPDPDLLLDGTINHPKSYSIAALLHPKLATEFEVLHDRLRDRILLTWQTELNARRGHGGLIRLLGTVTQSMENTQSGRG